MILKPCFKCLLSCVVVLAAALVLSSCAHEEGNLQLDSVMSLRMAKQREQESKKAKEERSKLKLSEIMDRSTLKTPEIDLLELPSRFVRYTSDELDTLRDSVDFDIPPFVEVMWRDYKSGLTVMAGRVDWDENFIRERSRSDFSHYLSHDIARGYDRYFKKNYNTGATTHVTEMNGILTAKVTSKYLEKDWYTDIRYFFVYKENYRLNLFIYGKNDSYEASVGELNQALNDFTLKLSRVFWEPLPFGKPDPDGIAPAESKEPSLNTPTTQAPQAASQESGSASNSSASQPARV